AVEFFARDAESELARGAPARDDDGRPQGLRDIRDRLAKAVKILNAYELRSTSGNHFSCGGRTRDRMSARACAPSISAPAAADEASHARVMSPAIAASRRISAALRASCTALISSA